MSNRNYESNIVKNFSDLDLNLDSDQKNDKIKPVTDEFDFESQSESQKEFANKN